MRQTASGIGAAYLVVVLIWATTPLAIQWGAVDAGFSFAAASRMVLGLLCALLVLAVCRLPLSWTRRAWSAYLCAGGGLFGAMYAVYWAATRVDSGLMSVIFGLTPLVTSLLSWFWLQEPAQGRLRIVGMLLGLMGLGVIFLDPSLLQQPGMPLGLAALLFGVLCHSASLVGVKALADESHPLVTTAGALLVATPLFLLAWWLEGAPLPENLSTRAGVSIVYLGVLGSVLGFALYYWIVQRLSSASVALILVITPVMALLVGRLFNQEQLPAQVWFGAMIIVTGLLLHQRGGRPVASAG